MREPDSAIGRAGTGPTRHGCERTSDHRIDQRIGWSGGEISVGSWLEREESCVTPPLTIAAVSYLNTAPLIEGLETWEGARLVRAVPSRIGPMLRSGDADIGLASVVDYARPEGGLTLLDSGMIGCDGETLTVRLFSSVPIDRITRVHADADSHTSWVLCDLVLRERFGVKAEFVAFDFREQHPDYPSEGTDAVLMIGDKVVTGSPPAVRSPHQIDLGAAWRELTGLPFVYACWMCPSDRVDDPQILNAAAMLDHARRRNRSRIDRIVSDQARALSWPPDLARRYIGELLRFEVDDRAKEGVRAFLSLASKHGLLPAREPVWVSAGAASRDEAACRP